MIALNLNQLATLVERERDALLAQWRQAVKLLPSAKTLDTPTLNDHIPDFLEELADAFRLASDKSISESLIEGTPRVHGLQRHLDGFNIVEVVSEYNILRGCVHDLVENAGLALHGKAFHILNRVFDEAIGLAVQTFSIQQALEVRRRREEYLAFVAHDLRTPLNAISLSARVLELTLSKPDEQATKEQMLKTLLRNVKHLELLVDKVLKENAHIQAETGIRLERRDLDLWPLVEALIHDLHPVAGTASTRLVNDIPEELSVYADAALLRRVFQNLVANAIRYTPRGEVVIGARALETESGVECWVADNGAGIPEERQHLVFDALETDPKMAGGTGLGLAIVKTFVEAHGGTVTVESVEGAGSTFRFTLPGRAPESRS